MLRQDVDPSLAIESPVATSETGSSSGSNWKLIAGIIAEKGASVKTQRDLLDLGTDVCEMLENPGTETVTEEEQSYLQAVMVFLANLRTVVNSDSTRGYILDLIHDKMITMGNEECLYATFQVLWDSWFGHPKIFVPLDVMTEAFNDSLTHPSNANIFRIVIATLSHVVAFHNGDSDFRNMLFKRRDCLAFLKNGLESHNDTIQNSVRAFLRELNVDPDHLLAHMTQLEAETATWSPVIAERMWNLYVLGQCLQAVPPEQQATMKNDPQFQKMLWTNLQNCASEELQTETRKFIQRYKINLHTPEAQSYHNHRVIDML
eukprot:Gregarina_sp_Poly_1__7494@NODE_417_length_8703_cov_212_060908_g339_i0_p3_GENE_NODE_417_length_8703_cov_212_060908_g339_i0NODE_417_length_8703_cov_212_060908_g339_i0_p3_ORF_typecomplete_len318_score45_40Tricho_coat/PF05892_11/0_26GCSF/PF16647_5/6_9GCSF/PF16647_5/3_7e02GCSF/PF16647_5/3_5e02_NODE_417_length_8703_cov_212_060908_g339_i065707523